jgi:hypothetical protein
VITVDLETPGWRSGWWRKVGEGSADAQAMKCLA